MNADNGVSPAATSTPLGKNPTQFLNTSSTPEAMQDVSVAPTLQKEGEIAPDSAMASVKSPVREHCHLPAVRISDGVIGVQPTAEWTQPPPGLIDSQKKDDDPIESFNGSHASSEDAPG